uniref:Wings apart-like protein homolog n=1 Tax=Oncorhynchus tshawytscha TaxID=74940 RepID=A0A8C8I8J5_ONCTS
MTSRFGKTYSRKGGDGSSSSKFDEVLSNKRATLSTKWGETTYKAKVSSKRPGHWSEVAEQPKRPKLSDEMSEDPFGFDSDDESKTVTSRFPHAKASPAKPESAEPSQAGRPGFCLESRSSQQSSLVPSKATSSMGSDRSQLRVTEDTARKSRSCEQKLLTKPSQPCWSSEGATVEKHSYSWYCNASESDKKPIAQTTTLKSEAKDSYDNWDAVMGLRPTSPTPEPPRSPPSSMWSGEWGYGLSLARQDKTSTEPTPSDVVGLGDFEIPIEPSESQDYSQSLLRVSTHCRTYRRPNKGKQAGESDSTSSTSTSTAFSSGPGSGPLETNNTENSSKPAGRGRTRDFTVLHPSCLSVFNVTIQDRVMEEYTPAAAVAAPLTDQGETGRLRKKTEPAPAKPTRFRPTQSKTKKDTKLDFFGFEENEAGRGASQEEASADPVASGSSNYKIKYFGFDDMSGSDSDEDEGSQAKERRKAKRAAAAAATAYAASAAAMEMRLYTVVQHVKHFNDVVEFGENQEFTDDFEYLATGLKSGQPLNTRCLSVISLATRCAMPSFRMHLRARGKVAQVFKTLNDAPQHPNLSLCTASLMYILSRDRLNMDLDRASLDLMIRLLELDGDHSVAKDDQLTTKEMSKVKEKIRKLCDTVHNKHLDLENITTGHLAMETLLSLTSKRAGDWFKEELRLLGGLDHIVDKVKECVENLRQEDDEEKLMASLWGAERCLRVLESVTVHNPENQGYLIAYKDSQLICSSAKALWHCEEMIQRYSREMGVNSALCLAGTALPYASHSNVGKAVEDCMRAIIGVLLNLTHDNEWGSTKTGEQEDMMMTSLNCVLRVPQYLPQERRFDIRVLGLGLLINLVEYSARNRYCLVEMAMDGGAPFNSVLVADKEELKTEGSLTAIAALVQLFLQREQAAIAAEAETDDFINDVPKPKLDQSGEWQESGGEIQWVASENNNANAVSEKEKAKKEEENEEIDLTKALQHAGKHMEDSIVASYTALLLGCLCQGSPMNVTTVRESLPKGDFSIMTEMLKKFLNFMNLTCDVGTAGQKSISRVIDYLEHC